MKTFTTLSLAILSAISFSAHAETFKIGTMSGKEASLLEAAKEEAKKQFNLEVEVVEFDDYVTPNIALNDGDIDANAFQHGPYLQAMVKDRGFDLVAVGNTFVYPIGLYSKKITSVEALKDGASIAIPNDPSNGARTLILMDKVGLIKLEDNTNLEASVLDITENPHNFNIQEIDAAQLPRVLDDVDAAFINSNYAVDAGLTPTKDAILREAEDSPYVNLIVVRAGDENKESVKQFVQAFQTEAVEKAAEEAFKGAAVKGW